jgi:hypothetical protein
MRQWMRSNALDASAMGESTPVGLSPVQAHDSIRMGADAHSKVLAFCKRIPMQLLIGPSHMSRRSGLNWPVWS